MNVPVVLTLKRTLGSLAPALAAGRATWWRAFKREQTLVLMRDRRGLIQQSRAEQSRRELALVLGGRALHWHRIMLIARHAKQASEAGPDRKARGGRTPIQSASQPLS